MSWQRILETARRRNLPVIVTDVAGREPLVMLSLEEYERVSNIETAPTKKKITVEEQISQGTPTLRTESIQVEPTMTATLADISQPISNETEAEALRIEERFYLEPMDDA